LDEKGELVEGHPLPLLSTGEKQDAGHVFRGNLLCLSSGQIGFTVRSYPYRKELAHPFEMGLLTWWDSY
jgi:hypothetical protein